MNRCSISLQGLLASSDLEIQHSLRHWLVCAVTRQMPTSISINYNPSEQGHSGGPCSSIVLFVLAPGVTTAAFGNTRSCLKVTCLFCFQHAFAFIELPRKFKHQKQTKIRKLYQKNFTKNKPYFTTANSTLRGLLLWHVTGPTLFSIRGSMSNRSLAITSNPDKSTFERLLRQITGTMLFSKTWLVALKILVL